MSDRALPDWFAPLTAGLHRRKDVGAGAPLDAPGAPDALLAALAGWVPSAEVVGQCQRVGAMDPSGPRLVPSLRRLAQMGPACDALVAAAAPWLAELRPPPPPPPPPPAPLRWRHPARSWATQPEISLWIDEVWPTDGNRWGLIAGVVWAGRWPDYRTVRPPRQHLLQGGGSPDAAESALRAAARSDRAWPFVVRVELPGAAPPAQRYPELLASAVLLVLGWLLPTPGQSTPVHVTCEELGGYGGEQADWFTGALAVARLVDPARFEPWSVGGFRWVRKDPRDPATFDAATEQAQGYLALADLIGAACVGRGKRAPQLVARIDGPIVPDAVSLSLEDVHRLLALRPALEAGAVRPLVEVAERVPQSFVTERLRADWRVHFTAPARARELAAALLDRAVSGDRPLIAVVRALATLDGLLPADDVACQALRALLELHQANHGGDPQRGVAAASAWRAARGALAALRPELAAQGELMVAVHELDCFDTTSALTRLEALAGSPLFAGLSAPMRARVESGLGQARAVAGDQEGAAAAFEAAASSLAASGLAPAELEADRRRLGVYRALLEMDDRPAQSGRWVKQVVGPIPRAAVTLSTRTDRSQDWAHHALLRWLVQVGDSAAAAALLGCRAAWAHGDGHPWGLIQAYRGLLLDRAGESEAADECFDRALVQFRATGATLRLVGGAVAAVAAVVTGDPDAVGLGRSLLDGLDVHLPDAREIIAAIDAALDGGAPQDPAAILRVLPYYYR